MKRRQCAHVCVTSADAASGTSASAGSSVPLASRMCSSLATLRAATSDQFNGAGRSRARTHSFGLGTVCRDRTPCHEKPRVSARDVLASTCATRRLCRPRGHLISWLDGWLGLVWSLVPLCLFGVSRHRRRPAALARLCPLPSGPESGPDSGCHWMGGGIGGPAGRPGFSQGWTEGL